MTEIGWGPGEHGYSRHAFLVPGPFERRTFKPRALCGMTWIATFSWAEDGAQLKTCKTCARIVAKQGKE